MAWTYMSLKLGILVKIQLSHMRFDTMDPSYIHKGFVGEVQLPFTPGMRC